MKKTLARLCAIVLLATVGTAVTSTPAHASAGWVSATLSYNQSAKILYYSGHAWGWGSTSFEFEGWLYNGPVLQEHIERATCTGFCYLPNGEKTCPAAGLWKLDVWAFPTDGTRPINDIERVTVI